MNYTEIIINLREEKDLLQKEVAEKLEISAGLYNMYEKQYKIIPSKYLFSLCDILDTSVDYLFNFSNLKKYYGCRKNINFTLLTQRLKEFRKDNNLTQKKLANILKVSQSVISDFEKEGKIIPTVYLYEICKKYNVSADYLLGRIDTPKHFKS